MCVLTSPLQAPDKSRLKAEHDALVMLHAGNLCEKESGVLAHLLGFLTRKHVQGYVYTLK